MSITSTEFADLAEEVFEEYMPTSKKAARTEFITVLIGELRDRGVEIDLVDEETESAGTIFDDPDLT